LIQKGNGEQKDQNLWALNKNKQRVLHRKDGIRSMSQAHLMREQQDELHQYNLT
jgi:hypothetical protein